MAKEKVTIQNIADALGISRNTVSKALNGNKAIPVKTRNKVLKKAVELKYKQFAYVDSENIMAKNPGNIALLTCNMPHGPHFGSMLLSGLAKKISSEGYNLSIHIIREAEIEARVLPNNFETAKVDGIICIEMFDKAYSELVCDLGIPAIFIDSAADIFYSGLSADLILMENERSIYSITMRLIENGHTAIGFIGDYNHCKSFNERWAGFNRALLESGLPLDLSRCIVDKDRYFFEPGWMDKQLDLMTQRPTAFICANDFIAVMVMQTIKNKGISVPDDIAVVGFDDAHESRVVDPLLTTVRIFNNDMGIIAAEMLLARVKNPALPYQITYVRTEPLFRDSTGKLK
ncbi:MAG: LacI family DNA-binding transcriptional regulator [Bacillota bacterium]